MVFWIWPGMCGNGQPASMPSIHITLMMAVNNLKLQDGVFCVVAAMPIRRDLRGVPAAFVYCPPFVMNLWGFVSHARYGIIEHTSEPGTWNHKPVSGHSYEVHGAMLR
jgi:hypothetical protein